MYKEYKYEMNIDNLYNIDLNYYNQFVVFGYFIILEGCKY